MSTKERVNPVAKPSGTKCVECEQEKSWWLHLRRCAQCGHIGCCDSSPGQHATRHYKETGHSIMQSFEPGEEWFWDYKAAREVTCPTLALPHHHPADQAVPGPPDRLPPDWQDLLH